MKKLVTTFLFFCLLIIITFVLFGNIEIWIESNLNSEKSLIAFSVLSFLFLSSDIILPIPSSLIMILNGKILGIFYGVLVSLFSGMVSSTIGFYIGKNSAVYVDKFFNEKEKEISNKLFRKFGNMAIIISKGLPIISEVISIMSGTTAINFKIFFVYSFLGNLIVSVLYVCVGSFSISVNSNIVTATFIITSLLVGWTFQIMLKQNRSTNINKELE